METTTNKKSESTVSTRAELPSSKGNPSGASGSSRLRDAPGEIKEDPTEVGAMGVGGSCVSSDDKPRPTPSGPAKEGSVFKGRITGAERKRRRKERESAGVREVLSGASGSAVELSNDAVLRKTTADSLKRGRGDLSSESSTPRQIKKVSEGARPTYSQATAGELKLAVVPELYPEERLTEEKAATIIAALEEAIDSIEEGHIPRFKDNWLLRGAQMIHCDSAADKEWLMRCAPGWAPWEGAKLRVVEQSSLLKMERVTVYVRGKHAPEVILKRLGRQNDTLQVQEWKILSSWPTKDASKGTEETAVRVLVEEREVEALKALSFRPFCGAGKAHVALLPQKEAGEGAMEVDPTPADGGADLKG